MATQPPRQPKARPAAARRTSTVVRKLSATPRKRSIRKPPPNPANQTVGQPAEGARTSRASGRQAHQIAILVLAIVFGLIGLAVHVFALASIVLMSVLLGLIAAGIRNHRDGSVIAELTAEAKDALTDMTGRG